MHAYIPTCSCVQVCSIDLPLVQMHHTAYKHDTHHMPHAACTTNCMPHIIGCKHHALSHVAHTAHQMLQVLDPLYTASFYMSVSGTCVNALCDEACLR